MILSRPNDCLVTAHSDALHYRAAFADVTETARAISDFQLAGQASEYVLAHALVSVALAGADLTEEGESISFHGILEQGSAAGFFVEYAYGGYLRGFVRRKLLPEFESDPPAHRVELLGPNMAVESVRSAPDGRPASKSVFRAPGSFQGLLECYFNHSVQIPTWAEVGVVTDPSNGVERIIALALQCLPDGDVPGFVRRESLFHSENGVMAALLDDPTVETAKYALEIPDLTVDSSVPLRFRCSCSREKSLAALKSLPEEDLRAMAETHSTRTVTCHFCGSTYEFGAEEIQALLPPSK